MPTPAQPKEADIICKKTTKDMKNAITILKKIRIGRQGCNQKVESNRSGDKLTTFAAQAVHPAEGFDLGVGKKF